ncbi:uncharacterized protein BX663DRAFT_436841 [Cokeromyces recurvatus]|uniref:uncharacterized protein n=1 Tax=Cokeromyces recurvatus TaxID=90255 RepID=UPI00221E5CC2|nr:uncharacterized protein BX663DRAFT_436841 [Cokeromyces recurvatus]KAI7901767.1 hypothetical protein BX663DRAFT_436841 [Cokeromyces recurvatus]
MPYTIPKDIINDVKSLINKGISLRNIAKATGVSKATVHRIKSAYFPTAPHTSPGRPSNISQTTSHALRFKVRQGYLKTAR